MQDNQFGSNAERLQSSLKEMLMQDVKRGTVPQRSEAQQLKTQIMRQPIANTAQTMDTMKGLADLLLKNAKLTPEDTTLLQNFVNGKETMMSEREARQLQTLLRLCQQNVPATVQQAAVEQNMPDLPRLWAFMQLCDMAVTRRMTARQLKKAGKDVAEFVLSMRHSMGGDNRTAGSQRAINFMIPLYMSDSEDKGYPSYFHIYDETAPDPITWEMKKETWLRLCVLTDNIGAVELTCRVYEGRQLDMRLYFSDHDYAEEFRNFMPELRSNLRGGDLQLNDFKIGAAGERRFL
mgnify:CR=1 FL=1